MCKGPQLFLKNFNTSPKKIKIFTIKIKNEENKISPLKENEELLKDERDQKIKKMPEGI